MTADSIFHRAIYLTGPTASGKTAVGVALARLLDAEILALDSITLYRGLDIATAKPTVADQGGIPHHLLDVLDPWESASVAAYRQWAAEAAAQVEARGKRILFVGGTPLYLKSLLRGLFPGPAANPAIRLELEQELARHGAQPLLDRLQTADPPTAAKLHPRDHRRIIRALEVLALTGLPISQLQTEHLTPAPNHVPVFALQLDTNSLNHRINARVPLFFSQGLIQEVEQLRNLAQPLHPVPAQAIGYHESLQILAGNLSLNQAIERIQTRTRQLAKRQRTWFRNLQEVQPFPIQPDEKPQTIAQRLALALQTRTKS
jgi:tRNA dimethylallyltransferase